MRLVLRSAIENTGASAPAFHDHTIVVLSKAVSHLQQRKWDPDPAKVLLAPCGMIYAKTRQLIDKRQHHLALKNPFLRF